MKLQYVSHSCFVIETNGTRIAFDPWISPSAYCNQWFLHPRPVDTTDVVNADLLLISHGHEDHLNEESLKLINKSAQIYFPFQWRDAIVGYMNHLGFENVVEALSFRKYQYRDIAITYLGYSLESVIVVECEGIVIVNINDALNSNHETAVNYLLKEIKSRWPKIDYMLSGWSGAGYFPNKVHYKGKDDVEVARLREQYFANNFCRFAKYLQPDIAIAFAPGFVLLKNENRWINEIKFPRKTLNNYYRDNFESETKIQFPLTFPGDYFEGKAFHRVSPYHAVDEKDMYKNLETEFKEEIELVNRFEYMNEDDLVAVQEDLLHWMDKNQSLYHSEVIADVIFSIKLTDVEKEQFLNICFIDDKPVIRRSGSVSENDRLLIETSASLLSLNLKKVWGGDLLSIGYGISVFAYDERTLEKNLDIVCVRLISRFPNFKKDFNQHIPRILKYYLNHPSLTNLWIKQKVQLRPYVNKYPFNERDHWLTYNKCDLCKVCNMPEVDFEAIEGAMAEK